MKLRKGLLIEIEGVDACGKETQTRLLVRRLQEAGFPPLTLSFPNYQTKTGKQIQQILKEPQKAQADPIASGLAELFVQNFAEEKETIENALQKGKVVVLDRYTASNEAYQSAKFHHPHRARAIRQLIRHLCFQKYRLPYPDIVLFLDLPPKLCEILKQNRTERDAYEKNLPFLKQVYEQYKKMARRKNWFTIRCFRKETILPKAEIAEMIWQKIKPYLSSTR